MAEALMFPEIDSAAIAPTAPTLAAGTAALAVVASTGIDLAKIDLEAAALARFESSREALKTAARTLTGVVHDLSTPSKLADAKSLRHRLINIPLAEARKTSAALKSKLTAVSKAVGAELVAIETGFDAAAKLITPQIEARDAELEAEAQRAEEERKRKAAEAAARAEKFAALLSNIRGYGTAAKGLPSQRIAAGITFVENLAFGPEWEEYAPQAAQAQAETLIVLRALYAEAKMVEDAFAAAEALRAENARLAAERAEQDRRMRDIQRINAYVPEAQAATVGQTGDEAAVTLQRAIDFISPMDTTADGCNSFGPLAPMADMAKTLVLAQLRSMLAEAQARAENERKAKQAADDLAAAKAAAEATKVVMRDPALDPEDEKPARDWPDLQTAELACATTVQSPAIETESEHFSIKITEATPEQRAQRMSPRIDVTFSAEASALLRSNCPRIDVVAAEPAPALPALLAHIQTARASRFPSNPKVGPEFWVELYRLADEVQA